MPRRPSPDLTELLSEVNNADRLANDARTRAFLDAGKRLLRNDLLKDAGEPADANGKPPFEEVLAWLTRRRIVSEANRARKGTGSEGADRGPTVAAFRYRWRTQAGYLRDLVIWTLHPRMERPTEPDDASRVIDAVAEGKHRLPEAISKITSTAVRVLRADQSFRLQMIFQATLAHDPQVADALCRINKANGEAWAEFARQNYDKLGLTLREDVDFAQLGCALHVAGDGVMFRAMLPSRPGFACPPPADLLALIAKALIVAASDLGDGLTLDEKLNQLVEQHRPKPAKETYSAPLQLSRRWCHSRYD